MKTIREHLSYLKTQKGRFEANNRKSILASKEWERERNAVLLAIPGATIHAVFALSQYPLPYDCFYQIPSAIAPDESRLFGRYPTDPFIPDRI